MYPFTWEHVYIPFLPIKLVDYLQVCCNLWLLGRGVLLFGTLLC